MENSLETMESLSLQGIDLLFEYGPSLLLAIVTLILGLIMIRWITRIATSVMADRKLDESLRPFVRTLLNITLKTLLVISVLGMVGVEVTSFIAILGAASLAIGMALSGTLQNFAGGVIILAFKPYKVGDSINASGKSGTVNEIRVFNTILTTPDNVRIIIPNSELSNATLTNYSSESTRRHDFKFGISYSDDILKAKNILNEIAASEPRILNDPEPFIAVSELGDNSVNMLMRVWCNSEDYWPLNFDILERVKLIFDEKGLNFPFPQRDVHLYNQP